MAEDERGGAERGEEGGRHLLVEHLDELDDARVGAEPAQRLDLAEVVDLLLALEGALHALDGGHLAVFHALGLEHLREGTLALLGDESIFCEYFARGGRFSEFEAGN